VAVVLIPNVAEAVPLGLEKSLAEKPTAWSKRLKWSL
jgi:hypothetical protein